MLRPLFLCLLLIYYWYFYASFLKSVPKPSGSPANPPPYRTSFSSAQDNHFLFSIDSVNQWEHTLTEDGYFVYWGKILQRDSCYGVQDGQSVVAKGRDLYDYLQANPEFKRLLSFKENGSFPFSHGDVFYFKCARNRIALLDICPSGTVFKGGECRDVQSCMAEPDGTLLPHPMLTKYFLCQDGERVTKECPQDSFFLHDRCASKTDLNHYCKFKQDGSYVLDDKVRLDCRNGKPSYTTCPDGMQFFDTTLCEPTDCVGKTDGTKIPLPKRVIDLFHFAPGYKTCHGGKVTKTTECPQNWDDSLTEGEDLTFLPMVFDGEKCSVPKYWENVFSDDIFLSIPGHEFTKHVKNWSFSKILDASISFTNESNKRKRKILPEHLTTKRFKPEYKCLEPKPLKIPLYGKPHRYFDCDLQGEGFCPPGEFFTGSTCAPEPENAFTFNHIPLFKFEPLTDDSWIEPWDYSNEKEVSCQDSVLVHPFNICAHPDCQNYGFLSLVPDLAMLLPGKQKSKCRFYENEKLIKKEPVDFEYRFWDQKRLPEELHGEEECTPGQKLNTGHFVWDNTVFATCDDSQPFVFCPSSTKIIPVDNFYACAPPDSNTLLFKRSDWTHFNINEIKRIRPVNGQVTHIRRNKATPLELLPPEGLELPIGQVLNLLTDHPVYLDFRYRVTYPPNVAFEYNEQIIPHKDLNRDHVFLVKREHFTNKLVKFPKYKPIPFVESFTVEQLY